MATTPPTPPPVQTPLSTDACEHLPELERLIYCYGQMLGAKDFIDEQQYFRNKIALHNRCLHGHGVVCGLIVDEYAPQPPYRVNQYKRPPLHMHISCGFALDALGRELVARDPLCFDFWDCVDPNAIQTILDNGYAYVTLCYHERKDPRTRRRLEVTDQCKDSNDYRHIYTRWLEGTCVKVSPDASPGQSCDPCCEPICEPGDDCGIWLARVELDCSDPDNVTLRSTDNSIRRHVTQYEPVKICHINWVHGHWYPQNDTKWLLGGVGLLFRFSAPVRTETLDDGVVDVWKIHEWPTDLSEAERKKTGRKKKYPGSPGRVESLPIELHHSDGEMTEWLRVTVLEVDDCGIGNDDRIMIALRGDFVLDKCCQPLDGNHVGGRVPLLPQEEYERPRGLREQLAKVCKSDGFADHDYNYDRMITNDVQHAANNLITECHQTHWKHANLTSGNGVPGGTFESWFFTKPNK